MNMLIGDCLKMWFPSLVVLEGKAGDNFRLFVEHKPSSLSSHP